MKVFPKDVSHFIAITVIPKLSSEKRWPTGNHWDPFWGTWTIPPWQNSAWSCSLPSARWIRWADLEAEDIAARNLGWDRMGSRNSWMGRFWMGGSFLWVSVSSFKCLFLGCLCNKCMSNQMCPCNFGKYAYTAYTMHRQKYQFHHKFGLHIESTNVTVYNLHSKILKYNAAIK